MSTPAGSSSGITPLWLLADDRVALYAGDGTERCLVCGWRNAPSYYIGQVGRNTDEGLPERFPVCDIEHGLMWIRHVWERALAKDWPDGA